MAIGGLDIATTTGLCVCKDDEWSVSSFRAGVKRPLGLKQGEVDFSHEGQVARAFRDHLRSWLLSEEIDAVAIEQPLTPNLTIRKPVVNKQASFAGQALTYVNAGGTNFGTIFRIYMLAGHAVELCSRLEIEMHVVSQQAWRSAFGIPTKAPRGTPDSTKWLKDQAKAQCQRLGIKVNNADQADSVGVAFWLRAQLDPTFSVQQTALFRGAAKQGALV